MATGEPYATTREIKNWYVERAQNHRLVIESSNRRKVVCTGRLYDSTGCPSRSTYYSGPSYFKADIICCLCTQKTYLEPTRAYHGRCTMSCRTLVQSYSLTRLQSYQLAPLHVDLEEVDPIHAEIGHCPRYGPHIARHLHLRSAVVRYFDRSMMSSAIRLRLFFVLYSASFRCCRAH